MNVRVVAWIAWPSFLVAGVAQSLFFTLFDPVEMPVAGELGWSHTAVYSVGFFLFWAMCAASSALTWFLQRSASEVNDRPRQAEERPARCTGPGKHPDS